MGHLAKRLANNPQWNGASYRRTLEHHPSACKFHSLPIMTRLGLGFGVGHAILSLIVFGSAITNPLRASLLPIVMFCVDLPFSFLFEFISEHVAGAAGFTLLSDAILYTVLGSAWFFAIGEFLSRLLRLGT
jgi:hypothetical protein